MAPRPNSRAELPEPETKEPVQRTDGLRSLGDPDLVQQLHPRQRGGGRRTGRGARLEPASGSGRRVVADIHLEDVLIGKPAGRGRLDPIDELAPAEQECEPGRTEEVLER